jgi:hypothetical protein
VHHREESIDVNEWLAHVTRHDAASPLAQRVRRSQRIYTSMSGRQRRWRCTRRPCWFASSTALGTNIPSAARQRDAGGKPAVEYSCRSPVLLTLYPILLTRIPDGS